MDAKNSFGDGYGDIGYALKPESEYFNINKVTGEITVKADLDREAEGAIGVYYLTVIAMDGGGLRVTEPPLTATAEVNITVIDINDNAPRFVECPKIIEFDENEPVGRGAARNTRSLRVQDKDIRENGDVDFTITGDKSNTFGIIDEQFDGDRGDVDTITYGVIYLKKQLDYEDQKEYKITVNSVNKKKGMITDHLANIKHFHKGHRNKKLTSEKCVITIQVRDVDEPPAFDEAMFQRSVLEGTEVGTVIPGGPITARDPDTAGLQKFEFELVDKTLPFRIDRQLGSLMVNGRLDREEKDKYLVDIIGTRGVHLSLRLA